MFTYLIVTQITLFTAIFFIIWSLSIFCTDYIDELLFLAFYLQSFYCTYSNITSSVVVNSPAAPQTHKRLSPALSDNEQRGGTATINDGKMQ